VYRLTLDMAKELAMVENNDAGRLARRYFILAEGVARHLLASSGARLDAEYRALLTPILAILPRIAAVEVTLAEMGSTDPTILRYRGMRSMVDIAAEFGVMPIGKGDKSFGKLIRATSSSATLVTRSRPRQVCEGVQIGARPGGLVGDSEPRKLSGGAYARPT
jgi:hypothetical protein